MARKKVVALSVSEIAARVGREVTTIKNHPDLPPADVVIGETTTRPLRGWLPETIDEWWASRPGRGARTDLRR